MKYWKAGIFFLVALLIQSSLLNLVAISGYTPQLMVSFAVVFTFLYDKDAYGILFGSAAALIYDIAFGYIAGETAIPLALMCIFIMLVKGNLNKENFLNMLGIAIAGIAIFYVLNWCVLVIAGEPIGFVHAILSIIWSGVYSLAVSFITYLFLLKTVKKKRKDWYFTSK